MSLTPELHEAIIAAMERGLPLPIAARACGADPAEVLGWYRAGMAPTSVYSVFHREVATAAARAEGDAVAALLEAARTGDSASAIRFLERRFPSRWGRVAKRVIGAEVEAIMDRIEGLEGELGSEVVIKILSAIAGETVDATDEGSGGLQ